MRNMLRQVLVADAACSPPARGRRAPASPQTRRRRAVDAPLTVDEAVRMALDNNLDLAADRLDPQIGDTQVAAAAAAFRPTVSIEPAAQQPAAAAGELPRPDRRRGPTSSRRTSALSQRLPWFGTSYSVGWDTLAHRQQQHPEQLQPAGAVGAVAERLAAAAARPQHRRAAHCSWRRAASSRDVADTRLRESEVRTDGRR